MSARLYDLYWFHAEQCREEARAATDPELCARWAALAADWTAMIPPEYRQLLREESFELARRRASR